MLHEKSGKRGTPNRGQYQVARTNLTIVLKWHSMCTIKFFMGGGGAAVIKESFQKYFKIGAR